MSKSETKLDVVLAEKGFRRTLYFNRIRVDRDDGFFLVQFGLVVATDLVDSYSCVFSDEMLKTSKESLIKYHDQLGTQPMEFPIWKGVTSTRSTDVADVMQMSFRDNLAEISLYAYSMVSASRAAAKSATELASEPLALLRSSRAFHKKLILDLYIEHET